MKTVVLGAGAIGSLYGAKLSKLNDVTLIARRKHAYEINKNGLKVTGMEDNIYKLNATTKIDKIEDNTLILLTTKVYDSEEAIKSIKDLIKDDTVILCLQNGLYNENIVKEVVKEKCLVLRGISNCGVAFLEPGVIQYNTAGYTAIEKSKVSYELVNQLKESGFDAYVSEDIKQDEWKKLIINCLINPLSAIDRVKNKEIADERYNSKKYAIADECLKVAEKDGVTFEGIDFVDMVNKMIETSENTSSMLQDIIKGKKTEIDYLNGAVVKLGKGYGIECPVNEGLVMRIKRMERSNQVN